MNRRLDLLHPYPFERLNALLADVQANDNLPFIALSLGEPKHAAPDFLVEAYRNEAAIREGFGAYPPTKGLPVLREAIAAFLNRRFKLDAAPIDAETQVLPVNGSREALFAFAQAMIDKSDPGLTLMPNPFYQIYEGAALLAGSKPYYLNCNESNHFAPDLDAVSDETWAKCKLIYICTPGNPTGAVHSIETLQALIHKANEFEFVIASDECYSEIYENEDEPPVGLLQAAAAMGQTNYRHCIAFNSLSKRSNLPGLRSGYVAGDSRLIEKFLLYRTYHGSAMSVHNQKLSAMAWNDEEHVIANRELYRNKYDAFLEILSPVWEMERPEGAFYLWPVTPIADTDFAQKLMSHVNIKVLPGSYLGRATQEGNPGTNRVRMALVATLDECIQAAERLKDFMQNNRFNG